MPGLPRRRRTLALITAAASLITAAVLCLVLWPSPPDDAAATPASRIDTQPRACLATTDTSNPHDTQQAWNGLRDAAKKNRTLVIQRFGEASGTANATFLNTLAQMRCSLVVTVGDDLSKATSSVHTGTARFITISSTPQGANTAADLTSATLTHDRVEQAILSALNQP